MKTFLALLAGWFMGIFTVAIVAGRVLEQFANGQGRIIDVQTAAA